MSKQEQKKPNILFIMADTSGARTLGSVEDRFRRTAEHGRHRGLARALVANAHPQVL